MNCEASLAGTKQKVKALRLPGFLHVSEASGEWVPLPKTEFPTTASRRSWTASSRAEHGCPQFMENEEKWQLIHPDGIVNWQKRT